MKTVQLTSKTITGLYARTSNADEMNPKIAKIGTLWQKFFEISMPTLKLPTPFLYGVYSNYESDAMGEFDVLVGTEKLKKTEEMQTITIEGGKYLCFEANGELPKAVIDTWGEIWIYFADEERKEIRSFKSDFECYTSINTAEIYIGIL